MLFVLLFDDLAVEKVNFFNIFKLHLNNPLQYFHKMDRLNSSLQESELIFGFGGLKIANPPTY